MTTIAAVRDSGQAARAESSERLQLHLKERMGGLEEKVRPQSRTPHKPQILGPQTFPQTII